MSTTLCSSNAASLNSSVAFPEYDREAGEHQIVHLGVGGFHRSHLAQYVDHLRREGDLRWRLVGVGVLEHDRALMEALASQDNLYTLVTVDPDGSEHARVIGALSKYLFAPNDPEAVVAALAASETRIVSMTITEGGYELDSSGSFCPRSEPVRADLIAPTSQLPHSALGLLVTALDRRRKVGAGPLTVMSCDNLPNNGQVAREAIRGFAQRRTPELVPWLDENVTFPNSMVDRITPGTTDAVRADVSEKFGLEDAWPVRSESFVQWVLEDHFIAGRPPFEDVGVHVVDDVTPYERMKLRLLNASHQAIGHLGLLAGYSMVHEAMRDPDLFCFLSSYLRCEALPTIGAVPGINLETYCDSLEQRFASDAVQDTLARQVAYSSDRLSTFLIPVIRDRLATGAGIEHSALVLASWFRLLEKSEQSARRAAELSDPLRPRLLGAVRAERIQPGSFLEVTEVFSDLATSLELRRTFAWARHMLATDGLRSALRMTSHHVSAPVTSSGRKSS